MANNSILEDLPEVKQLYRHEIAFPAYRGADLLRVPRYNKGMAFSLSERQHLGIHGLLPAAFETEELQVYRVICQLREENDNLKKYIILDNLQDQNEKLYYRVVIEHVQELLPIIYTPTVGLACQKFGHIFRRPKGIYITINDNSISKIYQILSNWPEHDVRAIVVTDGERILGLGDLGAYGMGIPIGKLSLYVAFGGVQPKWCLPIVLDCGTDSEELLKDPFYTGLRQKRVRGAQYDLLIDNFMKACVKRFGQKTLIQFEDFANTNAGRLLAKYRNEYATFNDDIQGTASIVVAGLLSCGNILQRKMSDQILLFLGAGAAATGTADMCVLQMQREGTSEKDACKRIFLINSKGLITVNSPVVKSEHQKYAKEMAHMKDLLEIIEKVRPTGIIGVSTVHGAFSEQIIRKMVEINERPIIFALSNPTSKSECTAEEAIQYTKGKALFASGSPFPDVNYDGKCYKPGQGNNSYIFPGIGLGVVLFEVRHIDEEIFLIAAREVASSVTEEDISFGCIYPSLCKIREISVAIALEIGKYSYKHGIAGLYPQPENMEQYIRSQIYSVNYDELIYKQYNWPVEDTIKSIPVLPAKENNS
ncbi:NAD-dependent malic enzyme, mitochondrial precursor, putative [Brugia malayi]|uniref:Malic enzyme n=1 Tax=Brugia malayi TaxID=6279 RepID=A0A4E9FFV8_BRUMA|nr:NAD-dependent malic enzyme, mitochondrial precursor, putative [Brugia malayi]VIO95194.1 NAD-dependent malic enzyme, mitochondrial precursor, putative [Brugia malayi]